MDMSRIAAAPLPAPRPRPEPAGGEQDATSFGEMMQHGIGSVADAERRADSTAQRFAVGDPGIDVHDVTVAAAEASVSVQLMVSLRDRAMDAYQQIMNLQV